jgi:hypothetical protein
MALINLNEGLDTHRGAAGRHAGRYCAIRLAYGFAQVRARPSERLAAVGTIFHRAISVIFVRLEHCQILEK